MSPKLLDEEALFHAARRIIDPAARGLFLNQACGDNAALAERVGVLLKMHEQEPGLEQSPPIQTRTFEPVAERAGSRIGPYVLREQIGEGGFGLVFVAEQQGPVRRKVALKIIKPGMDSKHVIARFEAERQALALMDHPNIAKVFDAGTTQSGRPYFVMELVRGVPITDYCDQNQLAPRERLDLFVTVCHAIQHAHQKGIIHRDVKPSNVLVTSHDGKPVAKVIDFGVAKAIHQPLTDKTIYTQFTQMIGTPLYMSPEQAEMSGLDIDTRSDIYSLGVLLYELLTGSTPLEKKRFAAAAYDEIRRLIREEDPPRPSHRLSTSATLPSLAASRGTEPAKLSRMLKGELDWIVMKALEKDRTRRYETATDLARDIQRYLADEIVEARPPTFGYRLRKFYRKNRAAALTATAFAGLLVAATTVSLWQARRASVAEAGEKRQRVAAENNLQLAESEKDKATKKEAEALAAQKRAEQAKADAQATLDYINKQIFSYARTDHGGDPDIKLRTVVENFAADLDKSAKLPPLVEASIRHTIGKILGGLERYPESLTHLQRAYSIRKELLGQRDPETIRTMIDMGQPFLWFSQGWGTGKEKVSEGESIAIEALQLAREILGQKDLSTLVAMLNVGQYHLWAKRFKEGEQLYLQFLKDSIETRGASDSWSITGMSYLAWYYTGQRRFTEAKDYASRAIVLRRKHQGEDHYLTFLAIETLAAVYTRQGRYADAEPLHRKLIAGFDRHVGKLSLSSLYARSGLAFVLNRQGQYEAAGTVLEDAIPLFRQSRAYQNRDHGARLGFDLTGYGDTLNQLGRFAAAKTVLEEALTIRGKGLGPDHSRTFNTHSVFAETLIALKQYEAAEKHLRIAYEGQRKAFDDEDAHLRPEFLRATLRRFVNLYEVWGKPDEGAKWRAELARYPERAPPPREIE